MRTVLKLAMSTLYRSLLAAWLWLHHKGAAIGRRRAARAKLAELDERTLRDIGLESWRSPLGAEVALRRHEMRRWQAAHIGLY
jgi:uncharacterized protein YjiS (DUF1127 family)